jgi:hypothetical protein
MTRSCVVDRRLRALLAGASCAAILLAMGCAGALEYPIDRDVAWSQQHGADVGMEELQAGRSAYVSNCAGCHHLHRPEEYAPAEWPGLVAKMAPRAKLSAEEKRLIASYLSATSARLRAPAPAETASSKR